MCDLPIRCPNIGRKHIAFSVIFLENVKNSLSERSTLSEFIKIHCRYAFPDALTKLNYHASRDFLSFCIDSLYTYSYSHTSHLFVEIAYQITQVPRVFDTRFLPFYTT